MPHLAADEDDTFRLSTHLHRANGYRAITNREEDPLDPLYTRSPFCKPEFIFVKPLRTLFVHPSTDDDIKLEEDVDVEALESPLAPPYDAVKARSVMQECERHVGAQLPDQDNPEWEDQIPKVNWSNMQARLFNRVVRLLHSDRLARLAHEGDTNEPVLRRTTVDKTARRLRQTLASVAWNVKYTQWLHNTLMDNLPPDYLVSYLDAIQTLKSKVPTLVDRMVASVSSRALTSPSHELLTIVYKRPWDPVCGGIPRYKTRKLPKDPILVMVPSGPGAGNTSNSRTHHWMANLSALGTVVCVYSPPGRLVGKVSVANCLDHMLASTKAKVAELHQDYGDKPIVLVGIGSGAALALQVALVEKVKAVVCLGFPMYTVEESRGTPDDGILNLQAPVLFVTGQNASTSSVEDLEDLREKLNVVTSLVVVGGADDQLRLTKSKKKLEKVTQSMVDKCVMDEVGDFLGTLLSPDYVAPTRPLIVHNVDPLPQPKPRPVAKPVERKRKSDIAMPANPAVKPPVPAKKGRKPKISMMQKMVHNKWAGQMPLATSDTTHISIPSTKGNMMMAGTSRQVVLDKKSLQQMSIPQPAPAAPVEGTITVVAASSPSLSATGQVKGRLPGGQLTSLSSILPPGTRGVLSPGARTVKGRLPGGQLTSLSSILPPGTRGVLSPGARTVTAEDGLAVTNISQPPLLDELNILDMPVILGDQSGELLSSEPLPLAPAPAPAPATPAGPIRLVLASNKTPPRARPPVKCTKIYISKATTSDSAERKTVYIGDIKTAQTVPKIRHIPATRNHFY